MLLYCSFSLLHTIVTAQSIVALAMPITAWNTTIQYKMLCYSYVVPSKNDLTIISQFLPVSILMIWRSGLGQEDKGSGFDSVAHKKSLWCNYISTPLSMGRSPKWRVWLKACLAVKGTNVMLACLVSIVHFQLEYLNKIAIPFFYVGDTLEVS